jgi:two-component system chemotaxis sensor kinase CheA
MTDMAREQGCAGGEDGGDLQADESVLNRLGDILVEMGEINEAQLSDALKKQTRPRLGEILEDEGLVSKENIDRALEKQKLMSIAKQTAIRIDTEKLDSLGNLAGELVIVESMLSQSRTLLDLHDPAVAKTLSQLNKITRYIQEQVMGMRMLPIKGTFQKLMRVARDTSRKAGKEVELIISGEGTEMDKTIIEDIGDPLVHIIRNSIDHGIELPEDRVAAGKPEKGVVELKASHRGGNIVIEVIDDGQGLNKERILAKAVKTGLVEANKNLTDEQIYNCIFEPGFSTASVVTELSGRGVGMDVVNKNIEKLNGNIEVSSEEGKGTTLTIKLPLTLAIIDGMLVRVGSERYIIPTISIIESFKADREQFFTIEDKGEMVKIRENLLPVLRLHELFNIIPSHEKPWDGIVIHVEGMGKKAGVLVDDLLGQQQVVIKSMDEAFRGLKGISGSAIMGDGNVVLILDSGGMLDMAV